jgi:hypothetical protein
MPMPDHVNTFCYKCGKLVYSGASTVYRMSRELMCRCGDVIRRYGGVGMLAAGLSLGPSLSYMANPSMPQLRVTIAWAGHLEVREGPHTHQERDTRQVREFLKTSVATVSPAGTFYRDYGADTPWGAPPRFSGFNPGEVTDIELS